MRITRLIVALAIAVFAVAGFAACGDDDDDGGGSAATSESSGASTGDGGAVDESKPPVKVSVISLKIPGSDILTPYIEGATAAADEINAAGGFGGRKVELESCNSQGQPTATATCARKTVANDPVAMIGCDLNWGSAGIPVYSKAGIPSLTCLNTPEDFSNPASVGITPSGIGMMRAMGTYLCTQPDIKRVTVQLLDLPNMRTYSPYIDPLLKGCGKEVSTTYVPITATDFTPHLNKVLQTDPDFVLVFPLSGPQVVQFTTAYKQANFPTDRLWLPSSALDYDTALEPAGAAVEGIYGTLELQSPDTTGNPAVDKYNAAMESAGLSPRNPNIQQGYMYIQALFTFAKEIGFDKFDGPVLQKYLNSATGVAIPLSRQLINPGPEDLPQMKQPYAQLVQWKDGKLTPVTEGTEEGWINGYAGP